MTGGERAIGVRVTYPSERLNGDRDLVCRVTEMAGNRLRVHSAALFVWPEDICEDRPTDRLLVRRFS